MSLPQWLRLGPRNESQSCRLPVQLRPARTRPFHGKRPSNHDVDAGRGCHVSECDGTVGCGMVGLEGAVSVWVYLFEQGEGCREVCGERILACARRAMGAGGHDGLEHYFVSGVEGLGWRLVSQSILGSAQAYRVRQRKLVLASAHQAAAACVKTTAEAAKKENENHVHLKRCFGMRSLFFFLFSQHRPPPPSPPPNNIQLKRSYPFLVRTLSSLLPTASLSSSTGRIARFPTLHSPQTENLIAKYRPHRQQSLWYVQRNLPARNSHKRNAFAQRG